MINAIPGVSCTRPKGAIYMFPRLDPKVHRILDDEKMIFDLLTQPDPVLSEDERETVKASAKKLLEHLHEKLVQDWRRKVDVMNDVDSTIRRVLDQELPETPYTLDIFSSKVRLVFDHVLTAYGDDGESAYTTPRADIYWPTPSSEKNVAKKTMLN